MSYLTLAIILAIGTALMAILLAREIHRYILAKSQLCEAVNAARAREPQQRRQLFVPEILDRSNWAHFEGSVADLEQVIVVADTVDKPEDDLLQAVLNNFRRGVRYSFLVSKSKAGRELHGYVEAFRGLARAGKALSNVEYNIDQLVSIKALPDEWENAPFVFYRLRQGVKGSIQTVAFHGNQRGTGISDTYIPMHPDAADALATALVSGAPSDIKEEIEGFQNDTYSIESTRAVMTNVIPIRTSSRIAEHAARG